MKVIILSGAHFTSKQAAHEYIAKSLCFPACYGKNLDALADCLSELPRNICVVLTDIHKARAELGCYADSIADVFCEVLGEKCRFIQI